MTSDPSAAGSGRSAHAHQHDKKQWEWLDSIPRVAEDQTIAVWCSGGVTLFHGVVNLASASCVAKEEARQRVFFASNVNLEGRQMLELGHRYSRTVGLAAGRRRQHRLPEACRRVEHGECCALPGLQRRTPLADLFWRAFVAKPPWQRQRRWISMWGPKAALAQPRNVF